MSEQKSSKKKIPYNPNSIIAIQDLVLEYTLSNQWRDYEGFARELSEKILVKSPVTEDGLIDCIKKFSHPFYSFNSVKTIEFIKKFPTQRMLKKLSNITQEQVTEATKSPINYIIKNKLPTLTGLQIFPELSKVSIDEATQLIAKLNIPERVIQDTLRTALREKGATNIVERKSDTSLEVADLEDFSLKVNQIWYSFVSVVKGYDSLRKLHVRWEDIAHQITKAYQGTQPDYILLVLAKDPVDGLITQLVNYGKSVGKRDLIVLMDTVDLARFLYVRGIF